MANNFASQPAFQLWRYLLFILVGIGIGFDTGSAVSMPEGQDGNLLQNPGFEGKFRAWSSIPEVQVAANWTPWWWDNPDHEPAYFRPEYKQALASVFPKRVLSGASSQQYFTFHASHLAGMYQQVFNVSPGQHYRFSIWAQVWSSTEDNANTSVLPANPHLQIGIDPTGNWNPGSPDVIWSPEASMTSVIDQWGPLNVEATAQNDVITVFMRTNPDFANKHNDIYWDNANLVPAGPPEPTPLPPTNTPGPPTITPLFTSTVPPTQTSIPVEPSYTQTSTLAPTSTPSDTPTPTNTSTPQPSPTSTPSWTPIPSTVTSTSTSMPAMTNTPHATEIAATDPGVIDASQSAEERSNSGKLNSSTILSLLGIALVIALLAVLVVAVIRRVQAS